MWRITGIISLTLALSVVNPGTFFDNQKLSFRQSDQDPPFYAADSLWVDSVFKTMTPDERIAQLLMVPAYSNKGIEHERQILSMIEDYKIGGLIFMQGGPYRQVIALNKYQNASKVPLLIAMDAEWSLSMRLDSTVLYPRQMMLGAIQDNNLIYEMGEEFARQLKRTGVHVNFAPVCDVNNNASNPVINERSFGEDRYNVAIKSYFYMKGMQDHNVLATGKHFPGHGDTNVDSHKSLPTIKHDLQRLDSLELFPFRYLTKKGIGAFMVAHLYVPAIDSAKNTPTTLSPNAVNQLLKKELGFTGLIFTDAMNMGGVTNHYKPGEADVLALLAGNDIILFPNEVGLVISEIKKAIAKGLISQEEIDQRCKKVLMAKYWAGLNDFKPISLANLHEDLNNTEAKLMQQKLIENSLTLVVNQDNIIPLQNLDSIKIASIGFGNKQLSSFQRRLKYYAQVDDYVYSTDVLKYGRDGLLNKLSEYDVVIVGVHNTSYAASRKFGISDETVRFIDDLSLKANLILDVFANPYSLEFFKNADKCKAIIVSYNDWEITNDFSAQLIFGGIPALGRLPVTADDRFIVGSGFDSPKIRLKYTRIPEEAGVDSGWLYKVDSIMEAGIKAESFPGGQIVATRNDIVFYIKSFGYHTYKNEIKVDDLHIYDLASVTKVIGTSAAIMKLYDEGLIKLDDKLSSHVTELNNSGKQNMTIKDILTHRAGLKSWIPFYKDVIKSEETRSIYFSGKYSEEFPVQVADDLYTIKSFRDSIVEQIRKSDMNAYGRYIYSDLGFYLFQIMIENYSKKPLPDYLYESFYNSLGAWSLRYRPTDKFEKNIISPTENDQVFRRQQLHGHVHDQGTAMLGGVCGHAGLFGSANDVAKMMQVFIKKGEYANVRYFSNETVELFTKYQFDPTVNRRGLGWDKPVKGDRSKGIGSESASDLAYGHSGYTGTMVWADPQYDLVYVFNSNRVYTNAENWKIIKMNIRTDIEEIFYQAIISYNENIDKN